MGEFQITINNLSGKKQLVTVQPKMTIRQLKDLVSNNPQFSGHMLSFAKSNLSDLDKSLEEYKIGPLANIYVLSILLGGI
jgi:hypothetical protein